MPEKVLPPLPRVTRGKAIVFGADPKGTHLLYTSGNSVILRNIKDFDKNDMYTQHSGTVNVAKYSPSGFYIASADKFGKVRIWDTVNAEHLLKNEFQPFSGPICDLAWTSDNQRILVGGSGQSQFGAVFNAETGATVGTIMGMSKNINSVDFRPTRPYRAITGDDEGLLNYFEGPPFKFKHFFQMFVYDGETGQHISEIGDPAHKGGIYGASFSKDGSRLVTVSGDKSLKLWAVTGQKFEELMQFSLDNHINNIMLGCCWMEDTIAAVTLNGIIHLFDAPPTTNTLAAPRRVMAGHMMFITCGLFSHAQKCFITASSDASMASWDLDKGEASMFTGAQMHTAHIQSMALAGDRVVTVGYDDRCVLSSIDEKTCIASIKLPSQPHCVGAMSSRMTVVVGCDNHLVLLQVANDTLTVLDEVAVSLGTCQLTVSSRSGLVMVCTSNDELMAFTTASGKLCKTTISNAPSCVPSMGAFSPDGSMIAFVDIQRTVSVFTVTDGADQEPVSLKSAVSACWQKQTARITAINWSPNGRRLATGSLDTSVIVWSLDKPSATIHLRIQMDGLECFDDDTPESIHQVNQHFFGCYLLVSMNERFRGRTYIGFTVNPHRRIGQHNAGRMRGGAKSTSGRGPWDMVLIVHGFPNEISALRFEWAWQNPNLSRRLSSTVPSRRTRETPLDFRFRVLCAMLRTGPWNRLGLVVRWINQHYFREFPSDVAPPLHIPVVFGPLQPVKKIEPIKCENQNVCGLCGINFADASDNPIRCPAACSTGQWHLMCIAEHMLSNKKEKNAPINYLVPLCGVCPGCCKASLCWPHLIAQWKRQST